MASSTDTPTNPAQSPDLDSPVEPNLELAQFAAGCFWGVELSYQRVEGVVKTEVGYSQGHLHNPTYKLVCAGDTNHAEIVRIHFDPTVCPYKKLLDVFWARHNPTTLNRQGNDVGTQYRSGIYYYNDAQAELAKESLEAKQKELEGKKIVTEILPAKRFYRAEEYHQQYLEKGGGKGLKQSAAKGCNDPIRCYDPDPNLEGEKKITWMPATAEEATRAERVVGGAFELRLDSRARRFSTLTPHLKGLNGFGVERGESTSSRGGEKRRHLVRGDEKKLQFAKNDARLEERRRGLRGFRSFDLGAIFAGSHD